MKKKTKKNLSFPDKRAHYRGRILCNFRLRMRTPEGTPKGSRDLRSLPVAMVLYYIYYYSKKKTRGKAGHAQNILPVKRPHSGGYCELPVAHAQNILLCFPVAPCKCGFVRTHILLAGVYRIFTKLGHKNPIYFGVIRSKVY